MVLVFTGDCSKALDKTEVVRLYRKIIPVITFSYCDHFEVVSVVTSKWKRPRVDRGTSFQAAHGQMAKGGFVMQ